MNKIQFSHRPIMGVSAAVTVDGDNAHFAFAVRNNSDSHDRRQANTILTKRLEHSVAHPNERRFALSVPANGRDSHQIMLDFRKAFKPVPDESDTSGRYSADFRLNFARTIAKAI